MKNKRSDKSLKRYQAAMQLMHEKEQEPAHVMQVARLALQLFDELQPLHSYGPNERDMLECAALLHDIGYSIGKKHHHRHAYTLITESPLKGWTKRQRMIIGNIARYHRKGSPSKKHKEYILMTIWDRLKIMKLSALLQLADGLDRSHSDAIKKLSCEIDKDTIHVKLKVRGEIPQELEGFRKKSELFKQIYKYDIMIKKIKNIWHIGPHHFSMPESELPVDGPNE